MSKELIICSNPHETRVAMLEDGQLCEIYIEREKEYALVGSIYKGRVTRVLPGMQSAFVDIGLDTDAFLYVSDVLEDLEEEYDHVTPAAEEHGPPGKAPLAPPTAPVAQPPAPASRSEQEPAAAAAPQQPQQPSQLSQQPPRFERQERPESREGGRFNRRGGRFGQRGRRGRRGGRDLPPSKYVSSNVPPPPTPPEEPGYVPVILPGESLAKYKDRLPQAGETTPAGPTAALRTEFPELSTMVREQEGSAREQTNVRFGEDRERPAASQAPRMETVRPDQEPLPEAAAASFRGESESQPFPLVTARLESKAPAEAPISEGATESTPRPEPSAAAAKKSGAASAETDEELSFEETAALTETLAEQRQAESLEEQNREAADEEQNGEASDEDQNGNRLDHHELEAESDSTSGETESSGPEPGNEISPVRINPPSSSLLQRPMGREHHRGGRRHRRRDRERPERPGRRFAPPRRVQQIADLLKAGQEVIIQITKEPLGKKGARITSHVAMPGRFLVYMPTVDHVGISRKIGTSEMRGRLRRLVEEVRQGHPGGFIVRTAAGGATEDDVRADAEYLMRTWQEIRAKSEQRRAPSLLHRDLNLVERLLRDCLNRDFSAVWVDSEEEYARVVDFVNRFQPDLVSRVKLYTKETPIFEEMGVQQEIDKSLRPKVWLKSGGYIVINHTEALVAIDVNTGKYVGRGSSRLEDTIVKTNIDAVKEIVRQIRLRDLGGIIVIDFIDMEERRNRDKVLQALEDALRQDRAPSKVLPFNEFGLVAITRKRTKQALERMLCQPCPYCSGSGMVKSVPTICYEIEAEARKMAGELDSPSVTLRVNPEIAKALKTREANLIEELERVTHKNIVIQSDATLHFEQYDIY